MKAVRRNLGALLVLAGLAVPLAIVSVAFACGRLATLYLFPGQVKPGATVAGYGRNYNIAPSASPVTLHFNSRTGAVLWTGRPNPAGEISPSFPVPHVASGYYLIMAEQNGPTGAPAAGTPGRAVLFIGTRRGHRTARAGLWLPVSTGGSGPRASAAPTGIHVGSQATLMASLLSGILLVTGLAILRQDRRRRRQPATTP